MTDLDAKLQEAANILEGKIVKDQPGAPYCVKGSFLGFPATFQATNPNWPFGVMYLIETEIMDDQNHPGMGQLEMQIMPRHARGLFSFFTRILLFESRGMSVRSPDAEKRFLFSHNDIDLAERFVKYPHVMEYLDNLDRFSHFSELHVRSRAGLFLSQPKPLKQLNMDICRETFKNLSELAQVVFETF